VPCRTECTGMHRAGPGNDWPSVRFRSGGHGPPRRQRHPMMGNARPGGGRGSCVATHDPALIDVADGVLELQDGVLVTEAPAPG
jgi:hypothetical protein